MLQVKIGFRNSAIATLASTLVLCGFGSTGTTANPALVVAQTPGDRLTIDPVPQITGSRGGVGVGIGGGQITPMAFSFSFNFGELSPTNTSPVVRISVTLTATTTGIREIRLSVPSRTFADAEMLQYSDIGVGVINLVKIGGGCPGFAIAPFNTDPSTSMTINAATSRATYPGTLANLVNAAGVAVVKIPAASQGVRFDIVFACVPSFYTPGSSTFVVTGTLNVASGNPCP